MVIAHLNNHLNHYSSLLKQYFSLFVEKLQQLQKIKIMVELIAKVTALIDLQTFDYVKLLLMNQT
jgi:hypothetical protein